VADGSIIIGALNTSDVSIGSTTATVDIDGTSVTVDATGAVSIDAATASNLTVSGATADLTLGARAATITLNQSGDRSLDGGFTATSIIGALNELLAAGGAAVDTYRWVVNGKPAVANGVDNAWIAPRAGTITRITLYRRTAGSSGSTIVDVDLNGTTVYTTQGNRPTVTQAAGNNAIDATTDMDVTAVAQDDRLEVNVDAVEAGNPQDISVILEIEYT